MKRSTSNFEINRSTFVLFQFEIPGIHKTHGSTREDRPLTYSS